MAEETVKGIMERVTAGTMDVATAARKIRGLKPREPAKSYYESHHEAAIETDPNSMFWLSASDLSAEKYQALFDAITGDEDEFSEARDSTIT